MNDQKLNSAFINEFNQLKAKVDSLSKVVENQIEIQSYYENKLHSVTQENSNLRTEMECLRS